MSNQLKANLRVCASCEFIFQGHRPCPKCGFASYGARFVYGPKCYKFYRTQDPYIEKKLNVFEIQLRKELENEI